MKIPKKQNDTKRFSFNWTFFHAARDGLQAILELEKLRCKKILLPAYIGYSTREGSGVFDPVINSKIPYTFYRLDENLQIDIEGLEKLIPENPGSILLLIHYFGFRDPNIERAKSLARKYDVLIVEDFAHGLFTFWQSPQITFDYAFFSLHKLLPFSRGGALLSKLPTEISTGIHYNLVHYDFQTIIKIRCENFNFLLKKLLPLAEGSGFFSILHKHLGNNVPQTFPILLMDEQIRDTLYFRLNEEGFGAVSLYHELISVIDPDCFTHEHAISKRILNLPLHQDTNPVELNQMIDCMMEIFNE